MKRRMRLFAALVVASLSVSLAAGSAFAASVYNATPNPLPPNVASVGFEATSTSEFGDYVHLAGTDRRLTTVTVTMSDWALYSDYASDIRYSGNSATWSHPITVNVYSVDNSGPTPKTGPQLAAKTQVVSIPWRAAADTTCSTPTAWRAGDGQCYNGLAFNATFDLSSLNVTLPDDVIVGVAYDTADYGSVPIGTPGPYNSLNVGVPSGQATSVGIDDNADNVFWNISHAPFYADGGASGVGTFRQDTSWTPNGTVAVQINASAVCTPTGFVRDGMNLTAAQIGGSVTGTLDATGCNIGAYNPSSVSGADIFGANYFGVLVNGGSASVSNSTVHDIGEVPLNGAQHGNAVVFLGGASGTISGNTVSSYQKNGITVSGTGTSASVLNNVVTGEGQIAYIAQNGIQISFGATSALVRGNTVSGNWYTPADTVACGLLLFDAKGVKTQMNTLFDNEVNLCNFGRGGGNTKP